MITTLCNLVHSRECYIILTGYKKSFYSKSYRDGIPKKQPNKVGIIPQYFYGFPSLYLLTLIQPGLVLVTWDDRMLDCDVHVVFFQIRFCI